MMLGRCRCLGFGLRGCPNTRGRQRGRRRPRAGRCPPLRKLPNRLSLLALDDEARNQTLAAIRALAKIAEAGS
eukprot:11187532-Lingulodinium_polyedra.AAC.1